MPRKKRTITIQEVPEEASTQEEIDLATFIEETGPSLAYVYVYRIPKFGDFEFLERTTVDKLRGGVEEYLRATYDAGKYQVRFRGSDGQWKLQKTINIGRLGPELPPAATAPTTDNLQLTFLREQLHQLQTMNMTLITGLSGRPLPDPAALLTSVVSAFSTLQGGAQGTDLLTKIKPIIELVTELRGGGEDNMYTVVKEWGKELGNKLVPAGTANGNGATAPVLINPRPIQPAPVDQPAPVAPAAGAEAQPIQLSMADVIRTGLLYLKHKAELGKDPDFWVVWILENQDEPQNRAIMEAIRQGYTVNHLLALDPGISDPATILWFRRLYDGLLHPEDFETMDSTGKGRNTDNPVDHARPGNGGSGPTASAANGEGVS